MEEDAGHAEGARGHGGRAPAGTSYTTSIVVMPPEDQWDQLQAIRRSHDRGYVRWPPHVNMAYPFVPQEKLQEAAEKLTAALASFQPFPLLFNDFDVFEHGKSSCTVWVKPAPEPSDALHVLQRKLEETFPECNELSRLSETGFTPHLSVANDFKTKGHSLKQIELFKRSFTPFQFLVKEVYIISRSGFECPFEVRYAVPLGSPTAPPHFAPNPLPNGRRDVVSQTRVLLQDIPLSITEEELHEEMAKRLDFPLGKYAVKLLRKNKTTGRQNKNTGKALIEVRDHEQQEKVLAVSLELGGKQIKFAPALA